MFHTVLIANRGEIALRVARACRELGIRVVAVHSTEDRDSAVVRYADEAVQIGPAASRHSYLNMASVIEAAKRTGAQAIHPGYGFLSEEADFAEICEANGIILIGPPAAVMQRLGDKATARSLMADLGLPVLAGTRVPAATPEQARERARDIGFPVIIKAVAGGGGRGMRVVSDPADFRHTYRETQATAQAVFGDGRVYVERYLEPARHVEIQILCDRHGNGIHLGARDCSIQRRHQKLIEESPPPGLPDELVARMGTAAVQGALAAGYVGAGTFEFLVDEQHRFYFIEVNCRIQVEHPVTEMVTGIDLVHEQLHIADGGVLRLSQQDVTNRGVALECRINAEDPDRDFLPTAGILRDFAAAAGPFVRVDTHAYPGYRVPSAYDSLLAKVIVWAPDRAGAVARMRRALDETQIAGPGVRTTVGLLREVIDHPLFQRAKHNTTFLTEMLALQRYRP
jgi:acetyl-CoA carboxylase biotin carboxylase subunit